MNTSKELDAIPLLHDSSNKLQHMYSCAKENSLIVSASLSVFERGTHVMYAGFKPFLSLCEKPVNRTDLLAATLIKKTKKAFPILKQPTDKVLSHLKSAVSHTIRRNSRKVLKTGLGLKTVHAIDWCLDKGDEMLDKLAPTESPAASENPENNKEQPVNLSPKMEKNSDKKTRAYYHLQERAYLAICNTPALIISTPIRISVLLLKSVKRLLITVVVKEESPSKSRQIEKTPEDKISSRRKLSPKKRLTKPSDYKSIASAIFGIFGWATDSGYYGKELDVAELLTSPKSEKALTPGGATKRKHSDDDSEEEEDNDIDCTEFDLELYLETYNSEDDSDYMFPDDVSTDSEEYSSDDNNTEVDATLKELQDEVDALSPCKCGPDDIKQNGVTSDKPSPKKTVKASPKKAPVGDVVTNKAAERSPRKTPVKKQQQNHPTGNNINNYTNANGKPAS